MEESAKRYIPVSIEEFCGNRLRRMEGEREWLMENLPYENAGEDGYITVEGETNIRDRMLNLLDRAEERVYLSCSLDCLEQIRPWLERLAISGKKVVLITDSTFEIPGVTVYVTDPKGRQIGLIADSRYVLTGEYGQGV